MRILFHSGIAGVVGIGITFVLWISIGVLFVFGTVFLQVPVFLRVLEQLMNASMFALRVFFFGVIMPTTLTQYIVAWVIASLAWGVVVAYGIRLLSRCFGIRGDHR